MNSRLLFKTGVKYIFSLSVLPSSKGSAWLSNWEENFF